MCGIAGFAHADSARPADAQRLRQMTDVIAYRGPDGEGFHLDGNVALGHRRLSIIDLATGDQPMSSEDGSVTVSFNGEIYNYVELREELASLGHSFRTGSDTEVLLQAYRQWGVDCQTHLNGMWAFALWDRTQRRLLLSRDRLGEKPLHYAVADDTLVFGSEIKSLLAWGIEERRDLQWVQVYAVLGFLPAPHTFYSGIRKLPAGNYLLWEDGRLRTGSYWELPVVPEREMRMDAAAVEAEFAALFADSVRIRMRSDVPFGAFLSGGLDSACVVATMSRHSEHAVRTFTIGFDEARYDERPLARLVAQAFRTSHHDEVVAPDAFGEAAVYVSRHFDEPFGDASAIPTGYVSRSARREVKMALTGDGGDEVLSGYTMYQGEKFAQRYRRWPLPVRTGIPAVLSAVNPLLRGRVRFRADRALGVTRSSLLTFERRLVDKVSWTDPGLIHALIGHVPGAVSIGDCVADLMRECPWQDPFYRLMYYHLKVSLPDRMLVKVDRMSMAHSLEVRAPFLDHRLVELLVGVHKDVKMRGMERKSILRHTTARQLPAALLRAPKRGFAVPLGAWFRDGALEHFSGDLIRSGGLDLPVKPLREALERNRQGEDNVGNLLWALLLLDRFYRAEPPLTPVG